MSTVKEIEAAIQKLSPKEVVEVSKWLVEYEARVWDKQMDEDAASGKLDKLWKNAEKEISSGKTRPLNELLDNE